MIETKSHKYLVTVEENMKKMTAAHKEGCRYTPDYVIDDDGVRVLQQARQFHWNLSKPHARAAKDLHVKNKNNKNI